MIIILELFSKSKFFNFNLELSDLDPSNSRPPNSKSPNPKTF
ncbi:12627_t:CDS:2 [Dentiscutata heterogama]|uniref:12627_t:CDS:1 n=1 Tax=Dentiscutata heterogama TaxID=1316150 RepID=A0ACA9K778_9GLOM|nr:12627_t:CDS:2 [Dentiscutata heterogama]